MQNVSDNQVAVGDIDVKIVRARRLCVYCIVRQPLSGFAEDIAISEATP